MDTLFSLLFILFVLLLPLLPVLVERAAKRAQARAQRRGAGPPWPPPAPPRALRPPPRPSMQAPPSHPLPDRHLHSGESIVAATPLPEKPSEAPVAYRRRSLVRRPLDVRRGVLLGTLLGPPRGVVPYRS